MSQITLHLGAALTGDAFTLVFRWIDRNGIVHSDEIIASNHGDDLVIEFDDEEILRIAGTEYNRETA